MESNLRKYGEAATVDGIILTTFGAQDFKANPTLAAGDVKISKDGGAFNDLATLPAVTPAAGVAVQAALSATEMQAARITIAFIDQTGPKEWEDRVLVIETYGHASAQHAFDLDTASTAQTGDSYALANGVNGFAAIKDETASILTDTAEIGAAGAGLTALASASNLATVAGYVDTEVTSILADLATLLTRLSATRAGYLDNLSAGAVALEATLAVIAAYVDTEVAAIKAKTDKLTFDASNNLYSTHAYATGTVVADGANGSASFKTDLASAVNDSHKDAWIQFQPPSALAGQVKRIIAYNGTTKFPTVSSPFTGTPAAGDLFKLINE